MTAARGSSLKKAEASKIAAAVKSERRAAATAPRPLAIAVLQEQRERELCVVNTGGEQAAGRVALNEPEIGNQGLAEQEASKRMRPVPDSLRPGPRDEKKPARRPRGSAETRLVGRCERVSLARELVVKASARNACGRHNVGDRDSW